MTRENSKIIYTFTDEAPALATRSLLPIIEAFAGAAGVGVETRDISLAGRIIANFPDFVREDQQVNDALAELGDLAKRPEANIIKLPNISASIPQLKEAIEELQADGYSVPDYPDEPSNEAQQQIKARYDRIKGSAVNPVLREGNSDRRAPAAVKQYARNHPHSMGPWTADSQTHVAHMDQGDFFSNEQSVTIESEGDLKIELTERAGEVVVLKQDIPVLAGEVVDATMMSCQALDEFLAKQIRQANQEGVLFSLHLKATMMKVSDPIIFGHAVKAYFADLFEKHGDTLEQIGVNVNNGLGNLLAAIETLPTDQRAAIEQEIQTAYEQGPALAMVDSDKGITNLHVPSDVIIDASMPAMIRSSGQMWNAAGQQQDTKAVIPDSSYADVYQVTIDFCKQHGAFDPATMGTVPNVGLMAQKAEEYGSHDKTFEIPADGTVRVIDDQGRTLMQHQVQRGDIWRMCQVKDAPVRDWVKLAVSRARATGAPAVFWLDQERAHDRELIRKVKAYLQDHDTDGLQIEIMSPRDATQFTLERIKDGLDTISVTGNVLRDYLTDLFPILELGTSAKMLSIVPLMNGGGLFETGAGGSAPKHVQQFNREDHLRWNSLGEFLALAVSLEFLGEKTGNEFAKVLGETLEQATGKYLEHDKSPSRKVGELDNRGSHFYLAMYWAQALAEQLDDPAKRALFATLATELTENEDQIVDELNRVQGQPVDIGGYYFPDTQRATVAMRPSDTLNEAIARLAEQPA
ncbi:MAG: NADP-dependent isocitrate dehydrogenase [Mariniblastus sp.]|nr:NADP-dependent isocitrate dehydrogenase [Mariniblastus sp.]